MRLEAGGSRLEARRWRLEAGAWGLEAKHEQPKREKEKDQDA